MTKAATKDKEAAPAKRVVTTTETIEERPVIAPKQTIDDDGDENGEIDFADMDALSHLREEYGGQDYRIRIEKMMKETGTWGFVDKVPLATFDLSAIRNRYGGGEYRVRLFNERGKYVNGGNQRFHVVSPLESAPAAPAGPPSPLADPAVAMLFESVKGQNVMLLEIIKSFAPTQGKSDLTQLMSVVKDAMSLAPKEKGEGFEKQLDIFLKFQSLFGNQEKEDAGGGIMSELMEAVKFFKETRGMMPAAGMPQNPTPPRPPQRQPLPIIMKPTAPGTPAAEPQGDKPVPIVSNEVIDSILFYVPKFVEAANEYQELTAASDVTGALHNLETWSDFLLKVLETETIPKALKKWKLFIASEDKAWDLLLEWAEDDSKVEKIFEFAPELIPHSDWAKAVIKGAYKQTVEPDDTLPDAGANGTTHG